MGAGSDSSKRAACMQGYQARPDWLSASAPAGGGTAAGPRECHRLQRPRAERKGGAHTHGVPHSDAPGQVKHQSRMQWGHALLAVAPPPQPSPGARPCCDASPCCPPPPGTSHSQRSRPAQACRCRCGPAGWLCAVLGAPGCRPPACGCSSRSATSTTSVRGGRSGAMLPLPTCLPAWHAARRMRGLCGGNSRHLTHLCQP